MKTIYSILGLCLLVLSPMAANAQKKGKKKADTNTVEWRYEVEATDYMGAQGTYQIKVWSYAKHPDTAKEWAKKNAVHAIVFKGYMGKGRNPSQSPLVPVGDEVKHEDFFKRFFAEGGDYSRFVSLANQGAVGPGDMIKTGKKEWKIGVVVSVDKANLRKYLEENKIIQSLGGMF